MEHPVVVVASLGLSTPCITVPAAAAASDFLTGFKQPATPDMAEIAAVIPSVTAGSCCRSCSRTQKYVSLQQSPKPGPLKLLSLSTASHLAHSVISSGMLFPGASGP